MTESMTQAQRVEDAIGLREPDRVPVVPMFDLFLASYAGITKYDLLFDYRKAELAFEAAYREFHWDGCHMFVGGNGRYYPLPFMQEFEMPGTGGHPADASPQAIERDLLGPGVFDEICRRGYFPVYLRTLKKIFPAARTASGTRGLVAGFASLGIRARRHLKKWNGMGVPCVAGPSPTVLAFDLFSHTRTVSEFSMDLNRHPGLVQRAMAIVNRFCIEQLLGLARLTGSRYLTISAARCSATFVSPRNFERFALPQFVDATERLVSEGITPFLHFDSDWTPMLEYLKELPARKCILNLDGVTDIFKAKEVLGDHMCIMGDVPASLLKLGTADEVDAYCERLIKEVGAGGGYHILVWLLNTSRCAYQECEGDGGICQEARK